jgi:hypothetical protein
MDRHTRNFGLRTSGYELKASYQTAPPRTSRKAWEESSFILIQLLSRPTLRRSTPITTTGLRFNVKLEPR